MEDYDISKWLYKDEDTLMMFAGTVTREQHNKMVRVLMSYAPDLCIEVARDWLAMHPTEKGLIQRELEDEYNVEKALRSGDRCF